MTIFVGCDDTLVVWHDPIKGDFDELISAEWHFNQSIVNFILNSNEDIVIWTGGGVSYAQMWFNRLENFVGHKLCFKVAGKYLALPTTNDVCIDDMPIKTACIVIHPEAIQ